MSGPPSVKGQTCEGPRIKLGVGGHGFSLGGAPPPTSAMAVIPKPGAARSVITRAGVDPDAQLVLEAVASCPAVPCCHTGSGGEAFRGNVES